MPPRTCLLDCQLQATEEQRGDQGSFCLHLREPGNNSGRRPNKLGRLKALSPRENLPGSTDDNRDAQEPASSGGVDTTHSLPSSPARIAGRSTGKSTSAVERDTRLTRWPTDKQMLLFRRRTIARPADDVAPLLPDSGTKQPALCSSFPFKTRRHAQFVSESAKFLIVPTPLGAR